MARSKADRELENLTDSAYERVITHLENKGTKKAACEILNISYNVSRLDKLLEAYKEKKERDSKLRADKRGKPASPDEISFIVTEYLQGSPIDTISKSTFRGSTFINSILEKYGIPKRNTSLEYNKPTLIPDESVRNTFAIKELVYSVKYGSLASIEAEFKQEGENVYRIWLSHENQQQFAYQPWWELASLQGLRDIGISI
jgi:hypothetical protein